MKEYRVKEFKGDKPDWEKVKKASIDIFPWYKSGRKQATYFQMLKWEDKILIRVYAEDIEPSASRLCPNSETYLDSCFEFFVSPIDKRGAPYINFEINCKGTLYLAYNIERGKTRLSSLEQNKAIKIDAYDLANDKDWGLSIEIPIRILEEMYHEPLSKDIWYANFYRCGGNLDAQYAVWNNIDTPEPDYHRPDQFGRLIFEK